MNYSNTHKNLVELCKKGNRKAQVDLYQLYCKAMYNTCLRMLNNIEDAEDILQNSFVDVFTKMHYFRYQSSIGAWIKRIVINNCINFLKKRSLVLVEVKDHLLVHQEPDNKWDKVSLKVPIINKMIRELPKGYRLILSLYLLEGYDHQEIADILNISVSTSKSQYSRAKKKLRKLLLDDEDFVKSIG